MKQLDQEFVDLARLMGASRWRLSFRVILPAVSPYIITGFKTSIPFSVIGAITAESTLSFFGFGPQPGANSTSLGKLIELSRAGARQGNWWLVVFPCGALVVLAVCINFIGDGLRDALDPKLDKGA